MDVYEHCKLISKPSFVFPRFPGLKFRFFRKAYLEFESELSLGVLRCFDSLGFMALGFKASRLCITCAMRFPVRKWS